MHGGLPWGKPSSDIHTSPTCHESATQSLSTPGTTVSRAWSQGRGGGEGVGVGACVVTESTMSHVGEEGRGHKALTFPLGTSESHTWFQAPWSCPPWKLREHTSPSGGSACNQGQDAGVGPRTGAQ